MKSKINKGYVLLVKDTKDNINLVNMLLNNKGKYEPYTPVFNDIKSAHTWLNRNKSELEDGSYFFGEITEGNKIEF